MAKELPYFKFITSEWLDGEITLEDLEVQGLFINICALYWSKEGRIYLSKMKKRFKAASEKSFDILIEENFLQIDQDLISISFLDEQLKDRSAKSLINSKNGKKGGRPRIKKNEEQKTEKKPNAFNSLSETKANESQLEEKRREEKREEEKRREKKRINNSAKAESDFLKFWDLYGKKTGKEKCFSIFKRLKDSERQEIFEALPAYIAATPDLIYRKNPQTWLNGKHWKDEIITSGQTKNFEEPKFYEDEL